MPKAFSLPGLIPAVIAEVADALAGVFLPAGCRLCETLLTCATRLPICEKCLNSFGVIGKEICLRCGLPLDAFPCEPGEPAADAASERHCGPCRMDAYHFDRARSVFRYEDLVVRAMVMLKFEEMEPLAEWFGERLARRISGDAAYAGVELVVPVPLHKVRQRERGFNQAELLSKRLARALKLPHQGVLLVRKRPRPDKHLLTERERWGQFVALLPHEQAAGLTKNASYC